MTNLKQAAMLALKALESRYASGSLERCGDAITALRTALEQQTEPVCPDCKAAVLYECVACSSNNYPQQQAEPVSELQRRYLESEKAFQQQAEPIGWLDGNDKLAEFMHRDLKAEHDKRGSATPKDFTIPVYTAPPQRKPLTEEMRKQMKEQRCDSMEMCSAFIDGWLSAEAAHGIKEGA